MRDKADSWSCGEGTCWQGIMLDYDACGGWDNVFEYAYIVLDEGDGIAGIDSIDFMYTDDSPIVNVDVDWDETSDTYQQTNIDIRLPHIRANFILKYDPGSAGDIVFCETGAWAGTFEDTYLNINLNMNPGGIVTVTNASFDSFQVEIGQSMVEDIVEWYATYGLWSVAESKLMEILGDTFKDPCWITMLSPNASCGSGTRDNTHFYETYNYLIRSATSAEDFLGEIDCDATMGDVNCDGNWNVLDVVTLANCVIYQNCEINQSICGCAGDINGDGNYNVLDIVSVANCILLNNCGRSINGRPELDTPDRYTLPHGTTQIEQDTVLQNIVSGNKTVEQIVSILEPISLKLGESPRRLKK